MNKTTRGASIYTVRILQPCRSGLSLDIPAGYKNLISQPFFEKLLCSAVIDKVSNCAI
jgi:hypothetical protein